MWDKLSPEQLEKFIHIQSLVARQGNQAAKVRALREYYDGNHPVYLSQRQKEFLGEILTEGEFGFAHNATRSIIDTLRERISVTGITVNGSALGDDDGQNADAAKVLWDWWSSSNMESEQIRLYRRALRDGRAYVMADYDNDNMRPRLTVHRADDGTTGITYHRDPAKPGQVLFANKYWYTHNPLEPGGTGIARKTTYLPHEIRKYQRTRANASNPHGWEPIMDEGDMSWPLPWVDGQGQPLGVALVEFQNPGGSEIEQVIGLQNALNKSWLDLIAAADTSGFPLLVAEYSDAASFAPSDDDTNLTGDDEFRLSPGRLVEVDGARVHRIEGSNLNSMIETVWAITTAMAGISRTPQYYLRPSGGSEVPSGEALKQLESGLVSRAKERQLFWSRSWVQALDMAWRIGHTFGGVSTDDIAIDVQWENPDVRNEQAAAATAEAHQRLGVPVEALWQMLGYDPEEIEKFRDSARVQRASEVAAIAAEIRRAQ